MPVAHKSYKIFQSQYGLIPASDLNDKHIIASRMLQAIYRGEKSKDAYCNMIDPMIHDPFLNFMRNKQLAGDAISELGEIKSRNRLSDEDRLSKNLLSSQPLAFNLFLPLKWDNYKTATLVFQKFFPDFKIAAVTKMKLEYVPGDELPETRQKIDNSCFDVYLEYENVNREKGAIGFEVKYTESFSQSNFNKLEETDSRKLRYRDAIKKYKNQFTENFEEYYLGPRYNQLFRNQLLTHLAMENDPKLTSCIQVVLHSANDTKCVTAIKGFDQLLLYKDTFRTITIEEFIKSVTSLTADPKFLELYSAVYNRYCNYELVTEYLLNSE